MADETKASTKLKRESRADWAQRISFWKQSAGPVCNFKGKMEGVLTIYEACRFHSWQQGSILVLSRRIIRPGSQFHQSVPLPRRAKCHRTSPSPCTFESVVHVQYEKPLSFQGGAGGRSAEDILMKKAANSKLNSSAACRQNDWVG